jgi:hypothetical protein
MQAAAQTNSAKIPDQRRATMIRTTLYELLEAIHAEVPPGNRGDKLATAVVTHLLDSGRIHLVGNPVRPEEAVIFG